MRIRQEAERQQDEKRTIVASERRKAEKIRSREMRCASPHKHGL